MRPVLLCGQLDADELAAWQAVLQPLLGDAQPLRLQLSESERAQVELALVANPAPGSLQALPRLRLIQSLWAGVDRLLADPTLPAGVPLARMVDPAMNTAMAETALWAVLSLHRGFFGYARQQREGRWQALPQPRADEVRVTVLGLGQMGATVAQRLAAQGYRVSGWRATEGATAGVDGIAVQAGPAALPPLLVQTDILLNLLPLTPATRGLLNADCFAQLPRGAAVVNLARGAHLVEADLLAALASGHLAHAVLDVFQVEPLPLGHAFWSHPAITVLPHAAAQTDPRSAAQVVAENLQRLHEGRPLLHHVQQRRGY